MGSGDPSRMELRPSLPERNLIAEVRSELVLHTLDPAPIVCVRTCMCLGSAVSLEGSNEVDERGRGGGGDFIERFLPSWPARAPVGELVTKASLTPPASGPA